MFGLSPSVACAEAICGVERQFLCQFGRSTLVLDPFLALDARFGQKAGVERQFTSSISGKPWMSTFQRNWKHAISSSVAPENPL